MYTLTRSGLNYDILGFLNLDVDTIGLYVGIGSNPQRGELWRVNTSTGSVVAENGSAVVEIPLETLDSIKSLKSNLAKWLDQADQAAQGRATDYQTKLANATEENPCLDIPCLPWLFKNY